MFCFVKLHLNIIVLHHVCGPGPRLLFWIFFSVLWCWWCFNFCALKWSLNIWALIYLSVSSPQSSAEYELVFTGQSPCSNGGSFSPALKISVPIKEKYCWRWFHNMKHSGNENLNQGLETFVFLRGFYKVSWSWWHGVFLLTYSKIVKCNCPGRSVYLFNNGNGVCIVPFSKNTFDLWTACLCQQCPDVVENDSLDLNFFCYKKNMSLEQRTSV